VIRNVCLLTLVLLMAGCGRDPVVPLAAAEGTDVVAAPFTVPAYYILVVSRSALPYGQAGADLCGIDAPPVQQIGSLSIQQTLFQLVTSGTVLVPSISGGSCDEVVGHPVDQATQGGVVTFANRINLTIGGEPALDIFFTDGDLPQRFNFTSSGPGLPIEAIRVSGLIGRAQ
jgi:hypothetical protein